MFSLRRSANGTYFSPGTHAVNDASTYHQLSLRVFSGQTQILLPDLHQHQKQICIKSCVHNIIVIAHMYRYLTSQWVPTPGGEVHWSQHLRKPSQTPSSSRYPAITSHLLESCISSGWCTVFPSIQRQTSAVDQEPGSGTSPLAPSLSSVSPASLCEQCSLVH